MIRDNAGAKKKLDWSSLWLKEDYWAIWLATIFIVLAVGGVISNIPSVPEWTGSLRNAIPWSHLPGIAVLGLGLALLTGIAMGVMKGNVVDYLKGFPVVLLLAIVSFILGKNSTLDFYGFSDVVWAIVLGMVFSNVLGKPKWLVPALQTELFIKTGLVLMGAEILFNRVLTLGLHGLGVAWLVPPLVIIFMYWYGTKVLKIESKSLVATVATCTSVCGVSAAIASGTAVNAKKEEISLTISISLIFTILMMLGFPLVIKALGISEAVGGAWIGGTVDSTGAVVVAGSMVGPEAMEVAAVIKMLQNTLIGFVSFFWAAYFVTRVNRNPGDAKPSPMEIWVRFPKFIIGFILASIIFSFILLPVLGQPRVDQILKTTKALKNWMFCLAFVTIGLSSRFSEMVTAAKGHGPVKLYLVGQGANILGTLLAALWFFRNF